MKFLFCLLAFLSTEFCFQSTTSFAQVFQHIGEKADAPSSVIHSITQDMTGFIWFATTGGFFRYDSQKFKYYGHDPKDSTSIASNYVTSVFCDSKGIIWACTLNGLSRYDSKKDAFQTFTNDNKDQLSISTNDVNCIAEDRLKNIWIGTRSGLNRVNVKDGKTKFTRFLQARHREPAYSIQDIIADDKNGLWLATSNGLAWMNNGKCDFFKAPTQSKAMSNDFLHLYNDGSGNILLGARSAGLMRFNISTREFERIHSFQRRDGIRPEVLGFAPDQQGKLWIATTAGLANFDLTTLKSDWYVNDPTNDHSLGNDALMSIFKDRSGGLWVGSYNAGIDYMNTSSPIFSTYPFYVDRIKNGRFINGRLGVTPDQRLWLMSFDKKQILFFDGITKKTTAYNLNLDFTNDIQYFYIDEHDVLWCAGKWLLHSYDIKNGIVLKSYPFPTKDNPDGRREAIDIVQDKQQRLWISGRFGLLVFDKKTGVLYDSRIGKATESVFEDSKGNIWIGAINKVWLFHGGTGKPEQIVLNKVRTSDMTGNLGVWRFTEDLKGRIWLVTDQGVRIFNPERHHFELFPHHQPDILKNANDIQADQNGYLWLNREEELLRYHPDKGTLQIYSYPDGIPKKSMLQPSSTVKDAMGMLFFNTNQESFSVNSKKISTNDDQGNIVMSSLMLFNKEVRANDNTGILKQSLSDENELVFQYDQNIFSLNFALLSYARSYKNKYRYRLDGFEDEWHEVSVPTASYMNLPAGNYTFVVYAANGDGLWMKKPVRVKITVLPPFWKTWFAYIFYVISITAVVYVIARFFWLRTTFRKESTLTQIKLDFFTNVSHEIRTHLSLISGPVEKAYQLSGSDKKIGNYLGYAKSNSEQLMLLVNELLDFRKIQTGNSRLRVAEHDITKAIKIVLASFEHLAKEKNIVSSVVCPNQPVLIWFDLTQMQKVFYNLLSNAYKFTPDGGKIVVQISERSNWVDITVEDNGPGISPEHLKNLFTYYYQADSDKPGYGIGLALSKTIVEQHKGYLYCESQESSGTKPGSTRMIIKMKKDNLHFEQKLITSKIIDFNGTAFSPLLAIEENRSADSVTDKPTLLIIEDNDELRMFIKELFNADYHILEAENGLIGLQIANEHLPDVVLCDVMMPEMNGITVCDRLKKTELTSHIPVVLLTAKSQNEHAIEGLNSGAADYVLKPFDPRILELKIGNLVRLRQELKIRYQQTLLSGTSQASAIADDVNGAFIEKLKTMVVDNISNGGFGVPELAFESGMSISVLYRKIKSMTGITVNDFIKTIRLNEAKKYMESGVYNVNEVSTMVGFESSRYFSKEFQKTFGKTPSEVRKQSLNL